MSKIETMLHKVFGTTPGEGVQPKEAIAYSLTGFGQNFICTIIGSYLTVFITDALLFGSDSVKIGSITGSMAVAFLMLLTRVYDGFNDPIMGSIVDKTRTKYGKCRPFLKWMAIPIAVTTLLCFLPIWSGKSVVEDHSYAVRTFVIITVLYVIWTMVYTVADVPYWGLSTCMTNDTIVRGNILTVARLICTLGAGIVTVGVPIITSAVTAKYKDADGNVLPEYIYQNADTLKWTYFICALVFVVIAIPLFFYGFKNTTERFTSKDAPPSFGHNIKLLFKNKQLLLIVLSGILGGARMVYTYTGGLYFAKYVLKNEALYSIITLLVVPGGLIASVLVPWMTKKFTKKWAYVAVHILGAVVMFVMYFVGYDATWKLVISAIGLILLGIPQGVNNIITYAMIGDTVDYLEWKTGERGEGICYAMQTLINKIGMAVGAFIGVFSYNWAGINPTAANGEYITAQGEATLWKLLVLSGALSMVGTVIPMFFYKITEKRQQEMVAEIAERKKADNQ
ncbi:MAG: glycoside-pentoside-hexuronide (GPH):cation symporter [Clostridiales bacterium]|nr:glycoside-pentoside-hexuronide (GPH):cation symporter [Clostridiales bacterium]